jgi:hypothetical protein
MHRAPPVVGVSAETHCLTEHGAMDVFSKGGCLWCGAAHTVDGRLAQGWCCVRSLCFGLLKGVGLGWQRRVGSTCCVLVHQGTEHCMVQGGSALQLTTAVRGSPHASIPCQGGGGCDLHWLPSLLCLFNTRPPGSFLLGCCGRSLQSSSTHAMAIDAFTSTKMMQVCSICFLNLHTRCCR